MIIDVSAEKKEEKKKKKTERKKKKERKTHTKLVTANSRQVRRGEC